jgi:hypothetical protein
VLSFDHPFDLVTIGALFGLVSFIWAGWGHEKPPRGWWWHAVLALLQAAGLALVAVCIPTLVRDWGTGTPLKPGHADFVVYVVVFWVEVVAAAIGAIVLTRRKRRDLVAPWILLIVALHFIALSWVFGQSVLNLAAALLVVVAVVSALLPKRLAAPSFWCGILGTPVFLGLGTWCAVAGIGALAA